MLTTIDIEEGQIWETFYTRAKVVRIREGHVLMETVARRKPREVDWTSPSRIKRFWVPIRRLSNSGNEFHYTFVE